MKRNMSIKFESKYDIARIHFVRFMELNLPGRFSSQLIGLRTSN